LQRLVLYTEGRVKVPDYPLYPVSRIGTFDSDDQYRPSADTIADIAEEARQAFFAVVAARLTDLYPDSTTYGDESPDQMVARDRIATDWVERHAWNNSAVQEYNAEACSFRTTEVYVPESLMGDWPEGITSVEISHDVPNWPGLAATVRGTRAAIYDYILSHWDGTDDLDEWADQIVADTEKTS
jgi:hypothetical protein